MPDKKPFDVVVVGELNADLVLTGDVVPSFGQVEQLLDRADLVLGSSAGIFACGAARLGLRVTLIGKVGEDVFGRFLLDQLHQRGVDASGVVTDPSMHTGLSVILARGADRAILTYPGAIPALHFSEINWDVVRSARHLHLASYFLLDALRPDVPILFARARENGLSTSLDTNFDPSGTWNGGLKDVLQHTDLFLPNETELFAITGKKNTESALEQMIQWVPAVALKLGERGGLARRGNQKAQAPALPVQVADTVGAGDTFDAGFIYGFLAGWELPQTLKLACACGSLSTRAAGGTAGQPSLEAALQGLP